MKRLSVLLTLFTLSLFLLTSCSSSNTKETPDNNETAAATSATPQSESAPPNHATNEDSDSASEDTSDASTTANPEKSTTSKKSNPDTPDYIDGHKVLEYNLTSDTFALKLDGSYDGLVGQIEYDDYYEGYVIHVSTLPRMVSHDFTLQGDTFTIIPPSGTYPLDEPYLKGIVGPKTLTYIKNGNSIHADCNVSNYSYATKYESEGGVSGTVEITSFQAPKLDASTPSVSLTGFDNETLYSQDRAFPIDYMKYSLVIVPMQTSINIGKLQTRVVDVTETKLTKDQMLHCSVFGTLYGVTLTYTRNGLDETEQPEEIYIADKIENECIYVNAELPTDFSSVTITGSYQYQSGLEGISVSLNDMMDAESYEILTVDSYTFPDEDY